MKTLVLTGGSSGIGLATVRLFAQRGWKVFSLSRHGQSEPNITHIPCDVTSKQDVQSAIQQVIKSSRRIDALISNAGYGISGPVEFTATEDAKRQFEVNFFGALNVVKAVLPIMRSQQEGRIIFTSSVAAVLSVPYQSFYSASKAALNAMALALANEVRPFHIRVSCLMPGDVSTGFTAARGKNKLGEEVYLNAQKAVASMEKDEINGMSPEKMASCFWSIANSRFPAPIYIGGNLYKLFCFIDRILPKRIVNWIEGKMY